MMRHVAGSVAAVTTATRRPIPETSIISSCNPATTTYLNRTTTTMKMVGVFTPPQHQEGVSLMWHCSSGGSGGGGLHNTRQCKIHHTPAVLDAAGTHRTVVKCYNSEGVPIKLTFETDILDDADLRNAIKTAEAYTGAVTSIKIYKCGSTGSPTGANAIVDAVLEPNQCYMYELPPDRIVNQPDNPSFIEVEGLCQAITGATLTKNDKVSNLTLTDFNWLTHPTDSNMKTVFVRDVYQQLWTVVKAAHDIRFSGDDTKRSHVLIIGNPGIGKSWSLNYLLYKALKENLTSLVILRCFEAWYCFHGGKCYEFQTFPGKVWVNTHLKDGERALLLHDIGKAHVKLDIGFEPSSYGRVCIVLASSPKDINYGAFQRNYHPVKFYCPMLTEEEFVSIHPAKLSEFEKYGGCLRGVGGTSREQELNDKIQSFDFGKASLNLISEDNSHRIVQVVPEASNSETYHLDFVSKYVEKRFFETRWKALKDSVTKELYTMLHNSSVRQLYGIPFEEYVQEYAHKLEFTKVTNMDGTLLTTSLIQTSWNPPQDFKLVAKTDDELHKFIGDSKPKQGRWIKPEISNFPVLDAFLVIHQKVYGVQVTISDTHQPTASKLTDLLAHDVSFGSHAKKKTHLDGVIFVVDQYRNPLMKEPQLVPKKNDTSGNIISNSIGDAWETTNPQYRLLVSCQEWQ